VPEPCGANPRGVGPELPAKQRLPDDSVAVLPTEASEPFLGGEPFQFGVVLDPLGAERHEAQAEPVKQPQGLEAQEVHGGAQAVEFSVVEEVGAGAMEDHLVLGADLADEGGHVGVVHVPVVVEAVSTYQ